MGTFGLKRLKLVGAGAITRYHVEAAKSLNPEVSLSVWDPSVSAREKFREDFPGAVIHGEEGSFWADPAKPGDVLVVCTPPFAHVDPVRRGLETGHPVLCEKPLALELAQAEDLVRLAKARGSILACCSSRFLGVESTERVKAMLASGSLGTPFHLSWMNRSRRSRSGIEYQPVSRWFLDRSRSGGGPLFDWGIYDFATMWHLLSPVSVTVASAWTEKTETSTDPTDVPYDVETGGGAHLVFHTAAHGRISVHYERAAATHGPEISRFELVGSRESVTWDWLAFDGVCRLTIHRDSGSGPESVKIEEKERDPVFCHQRPLRHLVDLLEGRDSIGMAGARLVGPLALARAVYRVAETGVGEEVSVPGD